MELKNAIEIYVQALNENAENEVRMSQTPTNVGKYKYKVEYLNKYARVTMTRVYKTGVEHGGSAHSFVVLKDCGTKTLGQMKAGDIMKPANYRSPAKHARGSVFAKDFKGYGAGTYGVNYLR